MDLVLYYIYMFEITGHGILLWELKANTAVYPVGNMSLRLITQVGQLQSIYFALTRKDVIVWWGPSGIAIGHSSWLGCFGDLAPSFLCETLGLSFGLWVEALPHAPDAPRSSRRFSPLQLVCLRPSQNSPEPTMSDIHVVLYFVILYCTTYTTL